MNIAKKLLLITTITAIFAPTAHLHAAKLVKNWKQSRLVKALWKALRAGNNEQVQAIARSGVDIQQQDQYDEAPLMRAVREGQIDIVDTLIKAHADPNIQDHYGETPLMHATIDHNIQIVNILIDAHANPNMQDKLRISALIYAKHHLELSKILLKANADPDIGVSHPVHATALMLAAEEGDDQLVHALLAAGADYNMKDKNFNTVTEYAFRDSNRRTILDILNTEKATRDKIRQQMATERIRLARQYLNDQPLSIDPLIDIFAEYATDPALIPNNEVRARRAAQTGSKRHSQEYKEE
jgi:hypothetical protein